MIKEKTFYKSFMVLALSLALQNLLTYGVNLMDTMMLGRYSQDAMGGVSLCNQVQFLLQMLVVGAGEGAVVMGSQYWGKNKLEPIPHIIGVALRFGGSLAVLMFGIVLFFPHQLLSLLSNSPTVIAEGEKYFQIICFTYIIFTITNILVASLRSIGVVKIGYMISGSTLIINVCLNYCLIYGHFGCPELGVRGAAIATLVSRCVELLIVIYYLKFKEHKLNLSLRKLVHIDTSYVQDYMHVSLPVLINQALWGIAQMVQTGILGHLGGDATAANAIAVQVYSVGRLLWRRVRIRHCGRPHHRRGQSAAAASARTYTADPVRLHRTVLGSFDLPSARTDPCAARRYAHRNRLQIFAAVHDGARHHNGRHLVPDGMR